MKRMTIITLLLLPFAAVSQPVGDPIYLIGTSIQSEYGEAFSVNRLNTSPEDAAKRTSRGIQLYKSTLVSFFIDAQKSDKGLGEITVHHYPPYDLEALARHDRLFNIERIKAISMEIIEKPDSFLNEIDYLDLDELLKRKPTNEELWELGVRLKQHSFIENKKIYMIDRNDNKDGKIFLIEVAFGITTKPEPPRKLLPARSSDTIIITFLRPFPPGDTTVIIPPQ